MVEGFADAQGVRVAAHDGSGLSYDNRVTASGMVEMLRVAEQAPWGDVLRGTLAAGGEGTPRDRLQSGHRAGEDRHVDRGLGAVGVGLAGAGRRLGGLLDPILAA